jgi:hypothetical protein
MSNGPIRTVTGPIQLSYALDSDRREMEYLLSFPFHAVDPKPWSPLKFVSNGLPITISRPINVFETHSIKTHVGNEEADSYCTIVHLSVPSAYQLSTDDGWKIIKRLLEWIRVKCRHYWLLHGIGGFGATYRGTLLARENQSISHQNVAMYGPNVIVNPLSADVWASIQQELSDHTELPLADSLFCDALLSIVAGDNMKALLEAGVAIEVALTQLLVDISVSSPPSPAKTIFVKTEGDRQPFGKKLTEWTRKLGLTDVTLFTFDGMPPEWHKTVKDLYKLRNRVAHSGLGASDFTEVVKNMFAAGALLEYCRLERLRLGIPVFSMPHGRSPWKQLRFCHNATIKTESNVLTSTLTSKTA